jgi:serine/threonine protein kinase
VSETLGRFELIAEIGRGGMADVTLALQREPKKLVVIKRVHEELAADRALVDMLLAEAKLSAQIKHPNVVEVFEHGEADGRSFIAMEYLEGEPLLGVLDKGFAGPKLDPLSMARIVADTAKGLEAAHALKSPEGKPLGIVHHDISLGNIFVLYSGNVKLLDFGVAKVSRKSATKSADQVFGKLAYMAPEKLVDRDGRTLPGDRRSDIWSLGCVLWEALTFKRLFKGANAVELIREVRYVQVPPPSTVNKDSPPELDAIALKALQRDPKHRYQSAQEMTDAIEAVLSAKGYSPKNFKIAAYMMKEFEDVIAARERLIREVTGPNRPSAAVIDAAFGEDKRERRTSSLPPSVHFDFEALVAASGPIVLPEGSTGADVAQPSGEASAAMVPVAVTESSGLLEVPGAPPPASAAVMVDDQNPFEVDDVAETVYDVVPANAEASRALRYEADPSWNRGKHGEGIKELQRRAQEARDNPNRIDWKRYAPFAAGGAILLVMIVVLAKSCGGEKKKPPAPVAKPAVETPVVVDAAIAMTPDAAIDAAEVPEEIEMPADEVPEKPAVADKPPEKDRPKPSKSAQALYAQGLAAWKKKDMKSAYALFTEGRRANSKYANNWYGLGLVHEKAGRKRDARTAYERYLSLQPKAPNAAKLRDHIKKNLM